MLESMGHDTGIDLDRLIRAARGLPALVGHEVPGQVMKAGQEHRAASAAGRHALTRARTWLRTRGSWVQILPGAP